MRVQDLGLVPYRRAWVTQEEIHAEVVGGGEERLLLVEHPPVITFGRRPGVERNVLASPERLDAEGIELVPSDRGGDVTLHAPGQLVVYPILRLADRKLSVGGYVHRLEDVVIAALQGLGIPSRKDVCAVGVWVPVGGGGEVGRTDEGCPADRDSLAKVCAIGVRIRRGVTLHGVALNVTTNLRYFDLIVPCGLKGRRVTSLEKLLGPACPSMDVVKRGMAGAFLKGFATTEGRGD